MADIQLHEHLTARLGAFARDQAIDRAARTCDLFLALVRREGSLSVDERGLTAAGRSLGGALGRDLLNIASDSSGLVCILFSGDRGQAASASYTGDPASLTLPRELATSCLARGESYAGTVELNERSMLLHAKPVVVGSDPAGVIVSGIAANDSTNPMHGLSSIETEILTIAEQIQSERQRAVSDFLKIIRSIAKRIHLLALNASILSAQAGEHGRGFAVVAREIGDLAERTRQSTQELESDFLGKGSPHTEVVERRQGGRRLA